jgi:hypothetical protein
MRDAFLSKRRGMRNDKNRSTTYRGLNAEEK